MANNKRFTLVVDESGEAGIEKVRSESSKGASPYMTLGAALIQNDSREEVEEALIKIAADFNKKQLHCSQLNHYQIIHFSRQIIKHNMRFFGVVSRKSSLGTYKEEISGDSSMYYNKCIQYLLERVGWFMESRNINPEDLDIVFEKSNNDYGKLLSLIKKCQENPIHENTKRIQKIDIRNIKIKTKEEDRLLQISDLIAHALYKCVDINIQFFGILEPRYILELSDRFFGNPENNHVLGAGIYCVHNLKDIKVESEIEEIFKHMRSKPPTQ